MIIATYNPEPGQTLEDVEKITTTAEKHFQDKKDVKTIQFSLGGKPNEPRKKQIKQCSSFSMITTRKTLTKKKNK